MNGFSSLWTTLRESLWFIPGLMLIGSVAGAMGLIYLDTRVTREPLLHYSLVFGLGAEGSRAMLTAIASSMLTVAALAFTLTINAVSQASAQYSPRVIRNFLRDRANQFVLGYFVSVFTYCLIVLRTIRGGDEGMFVPSVAVLTGLVLALGGVVVLIFFIHHIANSLQVTTIISNIVRETKKNIERLFPARMGSPAEPASELNEVSAMNPVKWQIVPARSFGYIQSVDIEGLLQFCDENDMLLKLERGVGQFIGTGGSLASVATTTNPSGGIAADDSLVDRINDYFLVQQHRTTEQDVGFGIQQIVDIALKALSPGVNDTTTALTCINSLSEIIGKLAEREFPELTRSKNGRPMVITKAPSFQDYVSLAFDQIRISGAGNLAVFEHLADAVAHAATLEIAPSRKRLLIRQIDMIESFAAETLSTDYERSMISDRISRSRQRPDSTSIIT